VRNILALLLLVHSASSAKLSAASRESQLRNEEISGFLEKGRSSSVEENTLGRLIFYPTSLESFGADGLLYLRSSFMSLLGKPTSGDTVSAVAAIPESRQQMYFRPVSVTLKCVMALTITSLLVYTAVSIARNYDELRAEFVPSAATQVLTIASRVGTFAPMMCMLFVSCRMYILATTKGLGEPPQWVKSCMYASVGGFVLQLSMVLLLPQFVKTGKEEAQYDLTGGHADEIEEKRALAEKRREEEKKKLIELDKERRAKAAQERSSDETGEIEADDDEDTLDQATGEFNDVHPALTKVEFYEESAGAKTAFWMAQGISIVLIYGGIFGVIVGIATFPMQSTKVSPAVICTVCLSGLYFAVCLLLWIARATGPENAYGERSGLTDAALSMTNTVRKTPMFAVLFLASRMRALNLDPPSGMPPFWMQCCFYGITGLLFIETIVAAVVGFTAVKCDRALYGYYIFRASKSLTCLQNFCALVTYGMLYPIIVGVVRMTYADGTPAPLSTTLHCVIILECVYFFVMTWQSLTFIAESGYDFDTPAKAREGFNINRQASLGAGVSLTLAPILCILFVATRMRALQITQQQGDPPGWAQDCMNVAVFACCIQALCCLLLPVFLQTEVDEDGNPDYANTPMVAAYALAVLKYVMIIALHGSVVVVCISVYVMTPETANHSGRIIEDRKSIFKLLAVTLGIFFIALLFSSAKVIGTAIKLAIEACDDTLLGVQIEVKNVALDLWKGYVKIHDLVVMHPEDKIIWSRVEGKMKADYPMKDGEKEKMKWHSPYLAKIHMVLFKMDVWRTIKTLGKEFEIENLTVFDIDFNVEKPSLDVKAMDSNVEYITCHMEKIGLAPAPDAAGAKKEEPKKDTKEDKKEEPPKHEKPKDKEDFIPTVILHRLCFGKFGVGVTIKNLPEFYVGIPKIADVTDVSVDIFNGREDLKPPEMVCCIVKFLAKKILEEVTHTIPGKIKEVAAAKLQHGKDAVVGGLQAVGHGIYNFGARLTHLGHSPTKPGEQHT